MSDIDPALKYEPHGNGDEAKTTECGEHRRERRDNMILKSHRNWYYRRIKE